MDTPPLGPVVDDTPRPLPARVPIEGHHTRLEPLAAAHAVELWQAAQGAESTWTYMNCGPFPSEAAFAKHIATLATQHDPAAWAVRANANGRAMGWLTLRDIQPANAAIELGNIWFSPALQRSPVGTEAMYLLLRLATELGYRRIVWKTDALNAASRRAAERLGFTFEGTLRNHMILKGRSRDSAMFSMTGSEWPGSRALLEAWLDPENFDSTGTQRRSLAAISSAMKQDQPAQH
jgi:RimJ/RimL family protein N-acetyltransferase